jgi:hypothetical protein
MPIRPEDFDKPSAPAISVLDAFENDLEEIDCTFDRSSPQTVWKNSFFVRNDGNLKIDIKISASETWVNVKEQHFTLGPGEDRQIHCEIAYGAAVDAKLPLNVALTAAYPDFASPHIAKNIPLKIRIVETIPVLFDKKKLFADAAVFGALLAGLVLVPQHAVFGPQGVLPHEIGVAVVTLVVLAFVAWRMRERLRFGAREHVRAALFYVLASELATLFQFVPLQFPLGSQLAEYAGQGELRFTFGFLAVLYMLSTKGFLTSKSWLRFSIILLGLVIGRYAIFLAKDFDVPYFYVYFVPALIAAALLATWKDQISFAHDAIVIAAAGVFGYAATSLIDIPAVWTSLAAPIQDLIRGFSSDGYAAFSLRLWVLPNILIWPALYIARPKWWK